MTQDFIDEVVEKAGKVVVKFGAEWCSPCRMMKPILSQLAEDNITVIDVDADTHPEIMAEYEVTSLPTMICFNNGENVGTVMGAVPKNVIVAKFN